MVLTERKEISQRNVLVDGQIWVQESTVIERDGVELSRTYHRHVVAPGDNLAQEDPAVQRLGQVEHTPAVIAAFRARQAAVR